MCNNQQNTDNRREELIPKKHIRAVSVIIISFTILVMISYLAMSLRIWFFSNSYLKNEFKPITINLHIGSTKVSQELQKEFSASVKALNDDIKNKVEVNNEKFDFLFNSISEDISTLEMMLTIMAIILALFAFLGIVNHRDAKYEILKNEEDAKKLMIDFQTNAKNDIENLRALLNSEVESARQKLTELTEQLNVFNSKISNYDGEAKGNSVRLDLLKKKVFEEVLNLKHPSTYKNLLDYIYDFDLFNKDKGLFDNKDNFFYGLHSLTHSNYDSAVEFLEKVIFTKSDNLNIDIEKANNLSKFYRAISIDDKPDYDSAISAYNEILNDNSFKFVELVELTNSNLAFTYLESARECKEANNKIKFFELALLHFEKRLNGNHNSNRKGKDDILALFGKAITQYELGYLKNNLGLIKESFEIYHNTLKDRNKQGSYEILYSRRQIESMKEAIHLNFHLDIYNLNKQKNNN